MQLKMSLECWLLVFGLGLLAGVLGVEQPAVGQSTQVVPGYTLPAEGRLALLRQAQQQDALREQAKAEGPTLTIVEQGKPRATIVGSGAGAKLLQEWVRLMSTAELPIAESAPAEGVAIFVGQAAIDAGLKLDDIESESNEGLRIRCDGKNVYIAAQSEAANIRAVGRFLEEEFGCRYLSSRPWGMVYPNQGTLKVLVREWSEEPTFRYRRLWGPEGAFGNATWLAWAGHGGTGTPMSHSWHGILPKDGFKTNPQWYRMDEKGNRIDGQWPNLGNPEARQMFIDWVLRETGNGAKSLSVSPPDDHRVDYSPEAQKYDEPIQYEPSAGRVSMTNRFLGIINEAAKKVYELNPKAELGFYAYSDYTFPPTHPALEHLSPNIAVWIAPIRFSRYHPIGHPHSESSLMLKEIIDGWAARASKIGWRTYNFNLAEIMVPFTKITVSAHDLPYLQQRGAYGVSFESSDSWELYGPHLYLSIRLAYDPTQDPWAIMADYWHKAYGAAAEPMMDYWMTIDEAFAHLTFESGSYHSLHAVYTPERMARLEALLDQAQELVSGDEGCGYRVNLARRGFRRAQYWRSWYDAIRAGDVSAATATYNEWYAFVGESLKDRNGNVYEERYMRRFIQGKMDRLNAFLTPADSQAGQVAAVLPDVWQYANDDMLEQRGFEGEPFAVNADESKFDATRTWSATLNEQGHSDYLGRMWYRLVWKAPQQLPGRTSFYFVKADNKVTLYINGQQVGPGNQDAFKGLAIDATGALRPGQENQITVLVDHTPLPELYLGGIVEPVYLISHPE